MDGQRKRRNQTKCPQCGAWGCPAARTKRLKDGGATRYRKCSRCGCSFKTTEIGSNIGTDHLSK